MDARLEFEGHWPGYEEMAASEPLGADAHTEVMLDGVASWRGEDETLAVCYMASAVVRIGLKWMRENEKKRRDGMYQMRDRAQLGGEDASAIVHNSRSCGLYPLRRARRSSFPREHTHFLLMGTCMASKRWGEEQDGYGLGRTDAAFIPVPAPVRVNECTETCHLPTYVAAILYLHIHLR
ncbi:hypothetical protein MVEN_00673200 [Mycena venus]|uniref:Uncharacterized protein n=1 Tax=Mycena venus TaxID=2733690 RepID=A0A8H7D5M9_9AGAR|nr:hypothetical protein MVEN_00673200 [Mycena venus]